MLFLNAFSPRVKTFKDSSLEATEEHLYSFFARDQGSESTNFVSKTRFFNSLQVVLQKIPFAYTLLDLFSRDFHCCSSSPASSPGNPSCPTSKQKCARIHNNQLEVC